MAKTSSKYTSPQGVLVPGGAKLVSQYSEQVTGTPQNPDADYPVSITIDRLWSGIRITWDLDTLGFNEIRIVRKQRDYAYSVPDGLTVYQGSAASGVFEDTTTTGVDVYYYTLWFRDADPQPWTTRYWLRVWDIALAPNDVPELLWSLLPAMYKRNEEERDNSKDMNIHVNRVIAPVVREIEDLTDFFPRLLDVDETPGPNLQCIAKMVGLIPNLELTYIQQREEIKAAVQSYKKKGLVSTLERMASAISGLVTNVIDWNQRLLITNWAGKTRPDFSDPAAAYNACLPGDNFYRRLDITGGGKFDTATYGVYVNALCDRQVTERTVRKLYRSLRLFDPVYMEMDLWVVQEVKTEQFDAIVETSWIEVDDEYEEDFTPQHFLTRNLLGDTRNTADIVRLENWPEDESTEVVS